MSAQWLVETKAELKRKVNIGLLREQKLPMIANALCLTGKYEFFCHHVFVQTAFYDAVLMMMCLQLVGVLLYMEKKREKKKAINA